MSSIKYKDSSGTWQNLILDFVYPIGAYYISNIGSHSSDTSNTPALTFGGTWANVTGRFLYCNNSNGTGGSNDMIIPYHRHNVAKVDIASSGGHTHYLNLHFPDSGGSYGPTAEVSGYTKWRDNNSYHSTRTNGAHTHSVPQHYTDYVGTSGNATNANMPAYRACYAWYRTA